MSKSTIMKNDGAGAPNLENCYNHEELVAAARAYAKEFLKTEEAREALDMDLDLVTFEVSTRDDAGRRESDLPSGWGPDDQALMESLPGTLDRSGEIDHQTRVDPCELRAKRLTDRSRAGVQIAGRGM